MGRKRNRRDLAGACADQQLVLARRNLWKADLIEGFVIDLDQDWALVNVVYDVGLNGWSFVRMDTIREVERQPTDCFLARALAMYGEDPTGIDIELGPTAELIATLAETFPLLTLFTEAEDPDVCAIGRPARITTNKVHLLEISADAVWKAKPRKLRLDAITRIDVGGSYEAALHHLGGYPPVPR